ncbi:hypothetical protein DVH24_018355 [Malus domestica]|uniref:TIR domain-containing protein n=1 Tax=Malus domestica TaxID=3750 RepID=A0A498KLV2_MALDO|nr:hypothetical protein DVH24_018355 [Malus domestica]
MDTGGGEDGKKEGGVQRVYLHQDSALGRRPASVVSISGVRQERKLIHAGLVSQPDVSLKEPTSLRSLRAEKVPPSEAVIKGPTWRDLLEPGVKHALVVGIGLQILQQIVGINGVLYYTLQVYEQASIAVLLLNIGCQHYQLGNCSECNNLHRRACCFVMAFGVTPNIVCLEIIPTSIHGLCIAICALAFWIGDVIITYAFPVMLSSVEFAGIFRIYVVGSPPSWKYDVFLSFRGEDTRTNFTDHFYKALDDKAINTFVDRQLRRGEKISPALLEAIEESRISIIVFSENYASSRWCLEELVRILECKKSRKQIVLPVFYKVDPSDVRKQTSSFGDAFTEKFKFEDNKEKILTWRSALTDAANLSGYTFKEGEYGTRKIKGIVVKFPKPSVIPLNAKSFFEMVNLEIFISRNAHFSGCIEYLPNNLRWIDFGRDKIQGWGSNILQKHILAFNLQSNCHLRHVVTFIMPNSDISQLKVFQNLAMLTSLNLSGSEFLEKIPNLSGSPNLRELILDECKRLVEVDDSVGFLDKLDTLSLYGCSRLERFATRLRLRSLQNLNLGGCTRLKSFPEIEVEMESLQNLYIEESGIRELPSSIAYLIGLHELWASNCENLTGTSLHHIYGLQHLFSIQMNGCPKLVTFGKFSTRLDTSHYNGIPLALFSVGCLDLEGCKLSESDFLVPLQYEPSSLHCWSTLRWLNLSRNNFVSLPDCISKFVNLKTLYLTGCKRLREIPHALPPNLRELYLDDCTSLEKIPKLPPGLRLLRLTNCFGVSGDEVAKLENNLLNLNQESPRCSQLVVTYPGDEVSKRFSYTSKHPTATRIESVRNDARQLDYVGGSEFSFEIPLNLQERETLLGLALSCVFPPLSELGYDSTCRIQINEASDYQQFEQLRKGVETAHVGLMLVDLEEKKKQGDICKVKFQLSARAPIKICGVHPLFRKEYERLPLSLGPTSSLGSSDIVDDEYDRQQQWPFLSSNPADDHPKRTQIDHNVPSDIEEQEQPSIISDLLGVWGARIKSFGEHPLLRKEDEWLPLSLGPTSSLGKRPRPLGSSDTVHEEYDRQRQWLSLSSNPADDHPKRRQIDLNDSGMEFGSKLQPIVCQLMATYKKIKGIVVKLPKPDVIPLNAKSFLEMINLEIFICHNACFSRCVNYLPNDLRWFDLGGDVFQNRGSNILQEHMAMFNLQYLPRDLVTFIMSNSGIKQLKGFKYLTFYFCFLYFILVSQNLANLTSMNLSCREFLEKIHDLSRSPNIKYLDLHGCTSLVEVDDSIGFLDKLVDLDLGSKWLGKGAECGSPINKKLWEILGWSLGQNCSLMCLDTFLVLQKLCLLPFAFYGSLMAIQLASSSSLSTLPRRYDVFLSFRGEDTRFTITELLYHALSGKGINTYMDQQLQRGEEIAPALFEAIEESRISVVILSKNYASSRWCLDELVKILQCRESKKQIVLPVFYKVDPSNVRKQTGSYGDAFTDHESNFKDNMEKVLMWRRALTEVANLSGHHFRKGEYGTKRIKGIVVKLHKRDVIPLNAKSFFKMVNLEIFIVHNAHFSGCVEYLPDNLRWIEFDGGFQDWGSNILQKPILTLNLQSNCHLRHLVTFIMPNCDIRQLKVFQNLAMLTSLNLSGSEFLEKIPNLSGSPNLRKLILSQCKSLVEVDDSVGFLDKLDTLSLYGCSRLERFVTRFRLRSLRSLDLRGCTRLKSFPEIEAEMESLGNLVIENSGIRELPSSITYLTGLKRLLAKNCENLTVASFHHIYGLQHLNYIEMGECPKLVTFGKFSTRLDTSHYNGIPLALFNVLRLSLNGCNLSESDFLVPLQYKPSSLHCWSTLADLDLSRNNFVSLPDCISKFVNLKELRLQGCKRLREIPHALPPNLIGLYLDDCTSLEKIPKLPSGLRRLQLANCFRLSGDEVAKLENNLLNLNQKSFMCSQLQVTYLGDEIPKQFSYTSKHLTATKIGSDAWQQEYGGGSEFSFEIRLNLQERESLLGLALSCVFPPRPLFEKRGCYYIFRIHINEASDYKEFVWDGKCMEKSHVGLMLVDLEKQGDICKVRFQLPVWAGIKICGVHPLLRKEDERLPLSLEPTSSLGSSDIVDDEYDRQQQWPSLSSNPADDHSKRTQIDHNVPSDIEEEQEQPFTISYLPGVLVYISVLAIFFLLLFSVIFFKINIIKIN